MSELKTVSLEKIKADPNQPRKIFDEKGILELTKSIEENGQIQPVIVRDEHDGTFTIVDGERRFKAITNSKKISTVDIIIRDYTPEDTKATQLIANWDREDISLMEKAEAINSFIKSYYSGDKIAAAKKLGKDVRTINRILSVYSSHPDVMALIHEGYVSDYSVVPHLNNLRKNNEQSFNEFVDRLKHSQVTNIRKELKNNPDTKPKKSITSKSKFSRHKPRAIVDVDINDTKIDTPILQISDKEDMYQFRLNTEQAKKLFKHLSNIFENDEA